MEKWKQGQGILAVIITLFAVGSLIASPQRAWADGDKGKDGSKIPIIVKTPIITDDGNGKTPPPNPAPPKKK